MASQDTAIRHQTKASDNIFTDLGFGPLEANKLELKAQLMVILSNWIKENRLTQLEAAEQLLVSRPRVSDVMTGKIDKFTIDALVDMVERSGQHVRLEVA